MKETRKNGKKKKKKKVMEYVLQQSLDEHTASSERKTSRF